MADDTKGDGSGRNDEFRAFSEARAALEAVELEHGRVERERRRLGDHLDGLLTSLRDRAVLLLFDADGELAGAEGPIDEFLGASLSDLVERFDDFADEDTRQDFDEANRDVMSLDSSGVAISRGFLRSEDERVGVTWVHLRRHDDDDKLIGTEVIGLVPPSASLDDDAADAEDPFEMLLQQVGRRMLDDSEESTIQRSIEAFGDLFSVDRVVINRYDEDKRAFSVTSSWLRGGTEPLAAEARGISISELPWAYSLLGAGEAVVISDSADVPDEAGAEKRLYAKKGVKASLLVPMVRNDHLFGFVSMQCARQQRDWSAVDVARAGSFVRILSGTLARREVEGELAEAREEAGSARERAESAEERREKSDNRAKEIDEKLEALTSEADDARRRIEELEKELEKKRKAESEARTAADDERDRAEEARKELEKERKDADKVRRDLTDAKADAERAQRRAKDAEADAAGVRKEFDEAQVQAEEALRDVTVARAELRELREADEAAAEVVRQATTKLAALDDHDPENTVELGGGTLGRGFDPDATLEMGLSPLDNQRRSDAGGFASRLAELDSLDTMTELSPSDAQDGLADKGSSHSPELEKMLEHTQIEEKRDARKELGDERWSSGYADKALPSLLLDEDDRDDDRYEEDRDEDDDEDDRDEAPRYGDERESAEDDPVDLEVAAARHEARRAAGIDGQRGGGDWWGVRAGDDAEDDTDEHDTEERDTVEDDRTREDPRRDDVDDAVREDGEEDDDIVFETAWDTRDTAVDDLSELDTAPPVHRAAFAADETYEEPDGEEEAQAAVALSDIEGIDAEIGLQDVGGNEELYRSLLSKFRSDYIGAGAKIDAAIEKGNIEVAHLLLHAIKGVSGMLGAVRLHGTADQLETRLIGKDPDATRVAVGEFITALDEVLDSVAVLDGAEEAGEVETNTSSPADVWDHEVEAEAAGVSDPMVLRSYLSGLRQHLLAEKPRQCRLVMREINARKWPQGYDERVKDLDELIKDDRFEDARGVFEELMEMFELG